MILNVVVSERAPYKGNVQNISKKKKVAPPPSTHRDRNELLQTAHSWKEVWSYRFAHLGDNVDGGDMVPL